MKLTISVLQNMFRKYLCNMDFLEKYNHQEFVQLDHRYHIYPALYFIFLIQHKTFNYTNKMRTPPLQHKKPVPEYPSGHGPETLSTNIGNKTPINLFSCVTGLNRP